MLPCSELRLSRGRLAWLIVLAPLLIQCNPERLVIVHVDVSKEVTQPVIRFEVRTSLDMYQGPTLFNLFDDAGTPKPRPLGIGIYHHQRSGDLTVLVHALDGEDNRVAGGSTTFALRDQAVQEVDGNLLLTPCLDPDTGSPMPRQRCPMPEPTDGGDAGDARDAGDAGDIGDGTDSSTDIEGGNSEGGNDGAGNGECPAGDAGIVAFKDTSPATPAACESYCATATTLCPEIFPPLPSPTTIGNPSSLDICRLACTASGLANGANPVALSCRMGEAMSADGSSDLCISASLIEPVCPVSPCTSFCRMNESICGVPFADCYDLCMTVPAGDERNGNTLICRQTWLERAMFDPTSCPAAQPRPICGPCVAPS